MGLLKMDNLMNETLIYQNNIKIIMEKTQNAVI